MRLGDPRAAPRRWQRCARRSAAKVVLSSELALAEVPRAISRITFETTGDVSERLAAGQQPKPTRANVAAVRWKSGAEVARLRRLVVDRRKDGFESLSES